MQTISIRYNGSRYPRTVNLKKGGKVAFFAYKKTLNLEEYDALMLLSLNKRLMPAKWEFTVEGVSFKEKEMRDVGTEKKTEEVVEEKTSKKTNKKYGR